MVTFDIYYGMKLDILVKSCRCERETLRGDVMEYHFIGPFLFLADIIVVFVANGRWNPTNWIYTDNILADTDLSELSRLKMYV